MVEDEDHELFQSCRLYTRARNDEYRRVYRMKFLRVDIGRKHACKARPESDL